MFAQVKSLNILNRIPPLSFHQVLYLEGQNSLIIYQTAVFSYAGFKKTLLFVQAVDWAKYWFLSIFIKNLLL